MEFDPANVRLPQSPTFIPEPPIPWCDIPNTWLSDDPILSFSMFLFHNLNLILKNLNRQMHSHSPSSKGTNK